MYFPVIASLGAKKLLLSSFPKPFYILIKLLKRRICYKNTLVSVYFPDALATERNGNYSNIIVFLRPYSKSITPQMENSSTIILNCYRLPDPLSDWYRQIDMHDRSLKLFDTVFVNQIYIVLILH